MSLNVRLRDDFVHDMRQTAAGRYCLHVLSSRIYTLDVISTQVFFSMGRRYRVLEMYGGGGGDFYRDDGGDPGDEE